MSHTRKPKRDQPETIKGDVSNVYLQISASSTTSSSSSSSSSSSKSSRSRPPTGERVCQLLSPGAITRYRASSAHNDPFKVNSSDHQQPLPLPQIYSRACVCLGAISVLNVCNKQTCTRLQCVRVCVYTAKNVTTAALNSICF